MTPSVLVIEDEANIRELVALHLRLEEMTPVEAPDGSVGLEQARNRRFDLVILDLMLPGLDGVTLCRAIRHSRAHGAGAGSPAARSRAAGPGRRRRTARTDRLRRYRDRSGPAPRAR